MTTDETRDDQPDTAAPQDGGGDPPGPGSCDPTGPPEDDDPGWPRSWIVISAVVGILAIVVVARLAGRQWRAEVPSVQPPVATEPAAPGPAPKDTPRDTPKDTPTRSGGTVLLVAKDVTLPSGVSCIGKDSRAHPCSMGAVLPEPCKLGLDGQSFRVELQRATSMTEMLIWIRTATRDPLLLYHAIILPRQQDEVPVWAASNQGSGMQVGIQLENMRKEPIKLKIVRFAIER